MPYILQLIGTRVTYVHVCNKFSVRSEARASQASWAAAAHGKITLT